MRGSGRSRCAFSPSKSACRTCISQGFVGFYGYHLWVLAMGQRKAPGRRRRSVRHCPRCLTVVTNDLQTESSGTGAPTLATPSQRLLDFSLRTPKRPMQMRQLGRLPVKSERRSLAWARHNEMACAAGVLPHFILSFILRHRPIFDVSDLPMLLGFRFSAARAIDSISVSFYHFSCDF